MYGIQLLAYANVMSDLKRQELQLKLKSVTVHVGIKNVHSAINL